MEYFDSDLRDRLAYIESIKKIASDIYHNADKIEYVVLAYGGPNEDGKHIDNMYSKGGSLQIIGCINALQSVSDDMASTFYSSGEVDGDYEEDDSEEG
jgi:hypothetical protein